MKGAVNGVANLTFELNQTTIIRNDWEAEARELHAMVAILKEENEQLRQRLKEYSNTPPPTPTPPNIKRRLVMPSDIAKIKKRTTDS
jgi:hypothetical protein